MNKLERRKMTRVAREAASRRAKFIEAYIKAKHVNVYEEADRVYKNIGKNNTGKKDLRKTSEFLLLTTKYKNIRQYYERPNRNAATKQYPDNMILNIQLMDMCTSQHTSQSQSNPDMPETTKPTSPPQSQSNPDMAETTEQTSPPQSQSNPDMAETTEQTSPPQSQSNSDMPETMEQTLSLISDPMYQQLIDELRNDPDLNPIFNNMNLGDDSRPFSDDDDIMELSGIDIQLQTPLEIELADIY